MTKMATKCVAQQEPDGTKPAPANDNKPSAADPQPLPVIVWRYPGADVDLAEALGEIAAELWLAGRLTLD